METKFILVIESTKGTATLTKEFKGQSWNRKWGYARRWQNKVVQSFWGAGNLPASTHLSIATN